MNWNRFFLVVIGAATVALLAVLFWPEGGNGATRVDWARDANPQTCAQCHPAIVQEWQSGWHAQARVDPELDQMSINKNMTPSVCNLCHAPRPVFESIAGVGQARTPANRTDTAAWPVSQGVDCLSCHLTPEGGMASANPKFVGAGRPDAAAAPCRPVYRPELADPTICSACHNQHGTTDQWRATHYAVKDSPTYQACQDCHMPAVAGAGTSGSTATQHRTHRVLGGHDPAFLRSAVKLGAKRSGNAVEISVDTTHAAHNFPTDYRTRLGLLVVEALDAEGRVVASLLREKWRQPFRNEPGGSTPEGNTQLRWQSTPHTRTVDVGAHAGPVRVRVFYGLRPYLDIERPNDFTETEVVPDQMFKVAEVVVK